MHERNQIELDSVNASCERFLVGILRMQIAELEEVGAGDIPFAHRARAYLRRYDASVGSGEKGRPAPPEGPRLRLVG